MRCDDGPLLLIGERTGTGDVRKDDALSLVIEPAELRRDARQLLDPAAPEHQPDQVEHRLADHPTEDLLGGAATAPRGERPGCRGPA